MSFTRVAAGLPECAALPQQVPALVQLDLQRAQTCMFLVRADLVPLQAGAKFALLFDKVADVCQGVVVRCHASSVPVETVGINAIGA